MFYKLQKGKMITEKWKCSGRESNWGESLFVTALAIYTTGYFNLLV